MFCLSQSLRPPHNRPGDYSTWLPSMEPDTRCPYRELSSHSDSVDADGHIGLVAAHGDRAYGPTVLSVAPDGGASRNLTLARDAYDRKDAEASRRAHMLCTCPTPSGRRVAHNEEHAITSSEYLKAVVFGGLDGIVTLFAIVAGCVGTHLTPTQTVIVGIGNLLADAVSMGFGEYVSASAEGDYMENERKREIWEVENFPEGERNEMMEIYMNKHHFTKDDAHAMVDIVFKYKDFCISHMMAEELGLLVDDQSPSAVQRVPDIDCRVLVPWSTLGGVMFTAFNIFGLIPLMGFSLWCFIAEKFNQPLLTQSREMDAFWIAAALSCVTLYILGAIKASFINQNAVKSGLQMMANGAVAGAVAYGAGMTLQSLVGDTPLS